MKKTYLDRLADNGLLITGLINLTFGIYSWFANWDPITSIFFVCEGFLFLYIDQRWYRHPGESVEDES